jgi:dissimilatory sulfite reductase (desulfoviridin) alpha/beta subunit
MISPSCATSPPFGDRKHCDNPRIRLQVIHRHRNGRTPKQGREIATGLTEEQALALARKVIAFYREHGVGPERLGATIERVGFDRFVKALT